MLWQIGQSLPSREFKRAFSAPYCVRYSQFHTLPEDTLSAAHRTTATVATGRTNLVMRWASDSNGRNSVATVTSTRLTANLVFRTLSYVRPISRLKCGRIESTLSDSAPCRRLLSSLSLAAASEKYPCDSGKPATTRRQLAPVVCQVFAQLLLHPTDCEPLAGLSILGAGRKQHAVAAP